MATPKETAQETQVKSIYSAMADVRLALPPVTKDSNNPAFRSKYASLGAVQEAANPVLLAHGFVPLYSVRTDVLTDDRQCVYTGLSLHYIPTGESLVSELGIIPTKQDAQGIGSAITYARRYLLTTMLDLTVDDDDGNAAAAQRKAQSAPPKSAPPKTAQASAPAQQAAETPEQAARRALVNKMHALGVKVYGGKEEWNVGRAELCAWVSDAATESVTQLTYAQIGQIVDYLKEQADEE